MRAYAVKMQLVVKPGTLSPLPLLSLPLSPLPPPFLYCIYLPKPLKWFICTFSFKV